MSDDSNKKPVTLSTPQAAANLDDVLASLEKQVGSPPIEVAVAPVTEVTSSSEAHSEIAKNSAVETVPTLPVVETVTQAVATSETAVQSDVTPIVSPFEVEEKQFEPQLVVTAPVAETLPSTDAVKDHPQMKTDSAVSFVESPTPTIVTPAPKSEKKGFLSGFSLTPKFIGAALVVALIAIGSVGAYVAFQTPQGAVNPDSKATGCHITYAGNSFSLSGCVGAGTITVFNGPSCPTTQTKISEVPAQDTGYSPQPPQGQCQQVDHNFGGIDGTGATIGAGGVCTCNNVQPTAPPKKSCGETCASDADCRNPSANGAAVACISGTCQNTACPGHTNTGVNCDCNVALRQCGQTCSGALGLCAAGQGICTYVNTTAAMCPWSGATTYCAGTQNGYSRVSCSAGDTGGQYLRGPSGKTTGFTLAEIQASCTVPASTPTPTPTPTITPTPTPTPTMTPTPTPTTAPQVCVNISSDTPNPVVGSQVRFTCGKVTGATSYEFRYKYSFAGVDQNIGTIPTNDNVSEPLVISQAATYKVQCRSCVNQSCTPWEAW